MTTCQAGLSSSLVARRLSPVPPQPCGLSLSLWILETILLTLNCFYFYVCIQPFLRFIRWSSTYVGQGLYPCSKPSDFAGFLCGLDSNLGCENHPDLHLVYKRINREKCKCGSQVQVESRCQKELLFKTTGSLPVSDTSGRASFAGNGSSLSYQGKEQGQVLVRASSGSEGAGVL